MAGIRRAPELSGAPLLQIIDRETESPQAFFISFLHLDRNFLRALPCRPFASACFEHSIDAALRGFAGAFSFICATATLPDARNAARLRAATNFHMPDPPNQDAKAVIKATARIRQQRRRRATVPSAHRTIALPSRRPATSHHSNLTRPATSRQPRDSNLHSLCCNARRIDCLAQRVEGSTRWMAFVKLMIISS
jgi:hypothetical protein